MRTSRHVRPTAMIDEGASQPCAFIASLIQKPNTVKDVQVRRWIGVTSASMLDHLSGSENVELCFGRTHPDGLALRLDSALVASKR